MSGKTIKILLVEDNPGDARLLQETLAEAGATQFELEHVERFDKALKRLAEGGIDVVLQDLSLPDVHGLDTVIRAHAQAPGVPIVVLTGLDDEALAVRAVRKGAQDYLVKDQIDSNLLVRAMRYAIERKRGEESLRKAHEELELRSCDLERRSVQLEAAAQVAREATAIRDVDQLLDRTVHLISERFGFYHAAIFLVNETGEYAVLRAASSQGGQRMLAREHRLKVGEEGIVGYVADSGKPRIALDVGKDAVFFSNPDLTETRSEMALPLKVQERVIGVLDVQSTEAEAFREEDVTVLQTMADQVTIGLENARLFQTVEQELGERKRAEEALEIRVKQLGALGQASQAVTASLELNQVLDEVVSLAGKSVASDFTSVVLVDESGHMGKSADNVLGVPTIEHRARDKGFTSWIVRSHQALVVDEIGEDGAIPSNLGEGVPRLANPHIVEAGVKSLAGLPLEVKDRLMGVLYLHSLRPSAFHDQLPLLTAFANQAAIAIENARLFEETRRQTQELARSNADLERRSVQLEAAAQVAREATAIRDVDKLLDRTVHLISKRFGFYHAGIFLVDEKGEYAVLRAASSQGGQQMLEDGHKLKVGEVGIVGYVTGTGQSRIALDVGTDAVHFKNPLLTETRSEMALPLKVGGRAIGALDVQSTEEAAFDEEDVTVLQTMADQVAIALENARMLKQTQERATQLEWLTLIESTLSQATSEEEILTTATLGVDMDQLPSSISLQYLDTDENEQPTTLCTVAIWRDGIIQSDDPDLYRHYEVRDLPTSKLWLKSPDETLFISDMQTEPHVDEEIREQAAKLGFRAIAIMPLRSGGRWQGLVTFLWTEPHTFSPEERFYLRRLLEPMEAVVASRRAYLAQQVARNESERRALQLQTAAEVSYAASSILDPDELIHRVVELVRERFDLYYVGLFLVDQTGEWTGKPGKWAVLRAGTGEAGRQMVEQNHTLEVGGESMIGWCIANAQARIALDVGEEAMHFDNQLLPDTRSEMALPLLSLGQVLGAMTIQSTQEAAFSEEDIAALQTMAGQLANAIQNARLVKEAQLRVKELEQAYEKQARLADTVLELSTPVIQVWENVLVLPLIGALDASRVTRIMENLLTGIVKYQAELVILDLTGIPTVDTNTAHYLMQTIKAAGLLGAQAILTGIRPEMAQTITSLGVELRGVPILANLRAGIEYALAPRFAFNQPLQK